MLKIGFRIISNPDYEYRKIIKKLKQYGIEPTGNKTYDKSRLKEIELRELKEENCVSNKHLTLAKNEQEKILYEIADEKKPPEPQYTLSSAEAEELRSQQIWQAIKLKKKLNFEN